MIHHGFKYGDNYQFAYPYKIFNSLNMFVMRELQTAT